MLGERWHYKAVLDAPNIFLSENNKQKYFLSSRNFYYWPVLNPGCISVRGRRLGGRHIPDGRRPPDPGLNNIPSIGLTLGHAGNFVPP